MEQFNLPDLNIIIFIVVISGVISWVGIEIFKKAVDGLLKFKKIEQHPWWHSSMCRLMSVVLGGFTGFITCSCDKKICLLIGAAAGALNTFIVMILKKYLKKKVKEE